MIDFNHLLEQFPQVNNRGVIQLIPTNLYVDWLNSVSIKDFTFSVSNIEPISFLIEDFDTQKEFDDWLACNYQLLFETRLNYACIDKTKWPENRTFTVFRSWFKVYHSNMILDLVLEPIQIN